MGSIAKSWMFWRVLTRGERFLLLGTAVLTCACISSSCTRQQRAIVRTVVDLVDQVCGDRDTLDECLGKAQAARAAAQAKIDAGTE